MRDRFTIVPCAILLAMGLVPTALAHGTGGFGHLNVDVNDLGPGRSKSYDLHPESDGMDIGFRAGWLFIVYGGIINGTSNLQVNLTHDGTLVATWVWAPTGFQKTTTVLPSDGAYELTVWNPGGNGSSRYAYYYDQSCNCAAKLIPLPGGFVIFNYDVPAGRDVHVGIPITARNETKGSVATLEGDRGQWPDDFTILVEHQVAGPGWLNFSFRTDREDRYYVFLEAIRGASLAGPQELTPLLDVQGGGRSPSLEIPLVLATVWLAFVGARPRRAL